MPSAVPHAHRAPATDTGQLGYDIVDVFTDRAYAGNPLAVVYAADGCTTEQLHAMAVEFNLSETAFPMTLTDADRDAGADYRVRIFTPGGEIPFAGHPTLGTAWALRRRGLLDAGDRVQSCGAGLIGVHLPDDAAAPVELTATPRDEARQLSPQEVGAVALLVGLTAADAVGAAHVAGCGLTWLYLRVASDAVSRSRPTGTKVGEIEIDRSALRDPLDGVCVYSVEGTHRANAPVSVSARVYVPGFGIPEDPATGSAAAGLGLVLVAGAIAAADGETAYRISQGVEMGRPSVLLGRVEASEGRAVRCHVAGQVVATASGTIAVPPS
ncbi:MAG: PhzF family phenazine biosynthesis protein [Nocardioidaceae bacterium]|nr:PhzF family phenazine biosynthesis protein [Nocardioidaceae bacterium]